MTGLGHHRHWLSRWKAKAFPLLKALASHNRDPIMAMFEKCKVLRKPFKLEQVTIRLHTAKFG